MFIKTIKAYRVVQPFREPFASTSVGRAVDGFQAMIVALTSDDGLTGWGEMAPLGSFYSAAFAAGAQAGIIELAPHLLRRDPRALEQINRHMDFILKGHPYIKSAIDMACCDLAAKASGVKVVTLLGGQESEAAHLYQVVRAGSPDEMAERAARIIAAGFDRIQIKLRGDAFAAIDRLTAVTAAVPKGTVIIGDANATWTAYQARQFADGTRDLNYILEQPCATIEECAAVRRSMDKPLVLDESVGSLQDLLQIHRTGVADGLTLKISRLGGVSRTRKLRDLALDLGFMITIEDTGGAEIDTAAMVHLSLSTPADRRLNTMSFHDWVTVKTAASWPPVNGNLIGISDSPGLGVDVLPDLLGEPFLELTT